MAQQQNDPTMSQQTIQNLAAQGVDIKTISQRTGMNQDQVAKWLRSNGYSVSGGGGLLNPYSYNKPAPSSSGYAPGAAPGGPQKDSSMQGNSTYVPPSGSSSGNPNADNTASNTTPQGYYGPAGPDYAAELAEKTREFDVTTARDIAKQQGTEVDALQQRLAALSGPKDAYADYFFSHGLLPPQGYKPAPVPMTQAQIDAYGRMGVTPQGLQQMIGGTGKPGADFGMLGNMGSSLQTPPGMPQPLQQGAAPSGPQTPNNPTVQGGPIYGKTPPGGSNVATGAVGPTGPTPPVPSMAGGGQVPGPPGTPSLAVVHGGEQVTPAPGGPDPSLTQGSAPPMPQSQGQGQSMMNTPGLHPAIAALVDAVSQLLQNPDFKPFVAGTLQSTQATPGGAPSMAVGGTIPTPGNSSGALPETTPLSGPQPNTRPGPQGIMSQPPGSIPGAFNSGSGANALWLGSNQPPQPPTPSSPPPPVPGMGVNPNPIQGPDAGSGQNRQGGPLPRPGGGGVPPTAPPSGGLLPPGGVAAGAQGVLPFNAFNSPTDNPIMPLANMDPYSRALYDIHGRLHPYSAQQEMQMGPQGVDAVTSYVSKVQGGDVKAYQDMVNRLRSNSGAPEAGSSSGEGFTSR